MKTPKLVVMAAGLGSRYGGLKQMEPVTDENEIILDFAVYDALQAGFQDVIFIVKPEMEEIFRERVMAPMEKYLHVQYVLQDIHQLPAGYAVPEGRTKPWGTCHAVMACGDKLDGPFAVINADDYYGRDAFKKVYDFLACGEGENSYCMASYRVENTLSDQGTVTRGVCNTDENGFLTAIDETKEIGWQGDEIVAGSGRKIPRGTPVSMNFWGFQMSMMRDMKENFPAFLDRAMKENPMQSEYLLPIEVERLLRAGQVTVKTLDVEDKWYGVTYKEDRAKVMEAFRQMKAAGKYPRKLWP